MTIAVDKAIEQRVGEVRVDALDISFGELMSLYEAKEFEISPDFQRLFRWELQQRSRLIESILLELPIPQIFVIEAENGVLELIDGLQRISSIIQFVQPDLLLDKTPLVLTKCVLIPELNEIRYTDLSPALRLRIKRAKVRAVIIKRQSSSFLRYEMFQRLNTGGSKLSEQEIRNCTARMAGEDGIRFYTFLQECARYPSFITTTSTLAENARDQRGDEELVLRFLALKNASDIFEGSVYEWLNNYMEDVIFKKRKFDYKKERREFERLFKYLDFIMGEDAFVRFRNGESIGGLAPAYFEAISLGVFRALDSIENSKGLSHN